MANLEKAKGFHGNNWPQTLRHAELAVAKLKQLKDFPIENVDKALTMQCDALGFMDRHKEALACAKERYCLYLTKHTHPPAIRASFELIQSCMYNKEFFDAALYARTLWETITLSRDSHIPDHQREEFTARGAMELARALWQLAEHGGMPAEEKQESGVEAIMLARKALEINTQLYGTESEQVAIDMGTLASVLEFFNDVDDNEILRLYEQSKAIFARVYGSSSINVAAAEKNLGIMYWQRARKALIANDLDRCVTNLELALPHFREAIRIYRAINLVDMADKTAQSLANAEEKLLEVVAESAAATKG